VVLPAVQDWAGGDLPARFLANLAGHASTRILAEVELAARQLPLRALVHQQQDAASLYRDPFHRNRERAHSAHRPTVSGTGPNAVARGRAPLPGSVGVARIF
jgi:hypothetical protein